jgi:hypothetical protein
MPLKDAEDWDAAFRSFARACRPWWGDCGFQQQLLAAVSEDRELAVVIWHQVGDDALKWLDRRIPALRGAKPRNCLHDPERLQRLKICLLSMW